MLIGDTVIVEEFSEVMETLRQLQDSDVVLEENLCQQIAVAATKTGQHSSPLNSDNRSRMPTKFASSVCISMQERSLIFSVLEA